MASFKLAYIFVLLGIFHQKRACLCSTYPYIFNLQMTYLESNPYFNLNMEQSFTLSNYDLSFSSTSFTMFFLLPLQSLTYTPYPHILHRLNAFMNFYKLYYKCFHAEITFLFLITWHIMISFYYLFTTMFC